MLRLQEINDALKLQKSNKKMKIPGIVYHDPFYGGAGTVGDLGFTPSHHLSFHPFTHWTC